MRIRRVNFSAAVMAALFCCRFQMRDVTVDGLASTATTIVRVCAGADCRVDGASDCLRLFKHMSSQDNANVKVVACPCLGPCGDGPNVVLVRNDGKQERIVDKELEQSSKDGRSGSMVPPDMFGIKMAGIYQVRSAETARAVLQLAGYERDEDSVADWGDASSVRPTRTWYDRPRFERLMLQRAMHVSILVGLAKADSVGALQWSTAAGLWVASNVIMKENLLEQAISKGKGYLKR